MPMRHILIAGLIGATHPAKAETCRDPQTQLMMNGCASEQLSASQRRMAAVLGKVMARLHDQAETRALLSKSQASWERFSVAHCTFSTADTIDGSIHPLLYYDCLEGLTIDRTRQLGTYVRCRDGDLNCPGPRQ